ncbi:MAG: hypothetical protein E6J91_51090 [Deltaproteobacteria bacterium]|nr:MAG: hypothetical protein E6J91_51090 [Deltaproteobacteria bacterium]
MRVFAFAWLAAACTVPVARPAAKPEPPTLDIEEPWTDPTADVPQRSKRPVRDRAAALKNPAAPAIAIRHATIMTASGQTITDGTIVLSGGAIAALGGAGVAIPSGARVVDGTGKFVTPGLIDAHSHLGVYAAPGAHATDDGNEVTGPVTAQARAQYACRARRT